MTPSRCVICFYQKQARLPSGSLKFYCPVHSMFAFYERSSGIYIFLFHYNIISQIRVNTLVRSRGTRLQTVSIPSPSEELQEEKEWGLTVGGVLNFAIDLSVDLDTTTPSSLSFYSDSSAQYNGIFKTLNITPVKEKSPDDVQASKNSLPCFYDKCPVEKVYFWP